MMFLASVLILISVGGSYSQISPCFFEKLRTCKEMLKGIEFPETTQDLLQACQDFQSFGSCTARAQEECGEDDQAAEIRGGVSYLSSMCEEDNPTFKVISSNLQCIKDVFGTLHAPCWQSFSDENTRKIREELDKFHGSSSDVDKCLIELMEITCKGRTFGHHCGAEVKDAVEEVLTGAGNTRKKCTPEILEELEPFSDIYLQILNEEIGRQNAVDKKR